MADSLSPVSAYGEFFIQYGQFLAAWNSFEVLVEVAIMRELRLTVQESRILNGALGFGAKSGILRALLVRTDELRNPLISGHNCRAHVCRRSQRKALTGCGDGSWIRN